MNKEQLLSKYIYYPSIFNDDIILYLKLGFRVLVKDTLHCKDLVNNWILLTGLKNDSSDFYIYKKDLYYIKSCLDPNPKIIYKENKLYTEEEIPIPLGYCLFLINL